VLAFSFPLRAAVAADAVVDVGNPLLAMLGNDLGGLMFMAAITGVTLVITARMAGRTGSVMMAVEKEEASMIECRRLPVGRLVAGCAWRGLSEMKLIAWSLVAAFTAIACTGLEERVIE
jgi:hypothetical protein